MGKFRGILTPTREYPYPWLWVRVFTGFSTGTDKGIKPMGKGTDIF